MATTKPAEVDTVLVSCDALAAYMEDGRFSVRSLARAVEVILVRDWVAGRPRPTCSSASIGHLRSGARRRCRRDRARAIEEALGATSGSLFRMKVRPDDWYLANAA
ncbi:helix-turn-helix DNA binding domain protein [Gordonia phage Aleemily]|uniref:Helix-turn-helix DNA binding domain protein n=2 Tax=Cafassovirus TaxID=3425056 RepID=A0A9E7QEU2_9CAUD|nr:helix-turn-helix DNA binding domain protein [Gordonia phage Cafasso]UVK59777.1 helix-turn-helix DNA binding domain protein [Gordonia phage Aleemily]